jgi:GNAT superfamily N-acetyltransferase
MGICPVLRSGSPIEVRDAVESDDAALDDLMAGWIGWLGAAFVRERFLIPDIPSLRLVARGADGIAAYGHVFAAPLVRGGRAPVTLFVHPGLRRRGIGTVLWSRLLEEARLHGVSGVMTLADHEDAASLAAATSRGAHDDGLHLESALDLEAPLRPGAIDTRPIPVDDEPGRAYVHDLVVELGHDSPDVGPDQEMVPRSAFDRMICEPWQGLLLFDGNDVAGITLAFPGRSRARRTPRSRGSGVRGAEGGCPLS